MNQRGLGDLSLCYSLSSLYEVLTEKINELTLDKFNQILSENAEKNRI